MGSSEPGRTQPSSPPAAARGALRELLGDRPERRAALELLGDAVGRPLGVVRLVGPVDRHEDLGNARFGLADVRAGAAQRVVDLGLRDVDLRAHLAADDLGPGDLRLDLLHGDVEGDAGALDVLLELAARHAGGALDVAEALLHLAVGGLQAEPLGVLDLQAFVDHLAQHLCGHALAQVRAVLQAGGADGEQHALLEVEIGDGVVVDARQHAQALGRSQCWKQSDDDDEKGAEEQR